jgi:protein-tyrosine phosphatase
MIDIHHHLLFETDDGPKDIDSSVAQAEAALADGITHIVATPHANDTWEFSPEKNLEKLEAIRKRVGDSLTLGLGCDFHLSYDNIEDALKHPTKFTINQGKYLLVEFAEFMIPQSIGDTFYEFTVKGIRPIVTHPERNPILQKEHQKMAEWMRTGCLVQITASSLGGRFGKRAQALAWDLLAKKYGEGTAERLCVDNPRAAFENRPLGPQPEPEGVYVYEDEASRKPQGLMGRLFGK